MVDKVDRFAIMNEQIERAREKSQTYRGPCSTCRWQVPGFLNAYCTHPVVTDAVAFNIADDYDRDRIQHCTEQRDESSVCGPVVCGPQGLLHERRLSWWDRLWGARYDDGT